MMKLGQISYAVLFTSTTLLLSACQSTNTKPHNTSNFVQQSDHPFAADAKQRISGLASISVLSYNMPYLNGKTQVATAYMMMPKTPKPKDGYRVVVWTHGTVGVGNKCAPSQRPVNENFAVAAKSLLDAGYVVVAPDYEGLGTAGIHPYLHLQSEARSVMYLMQAVKAQFGDQLSGDWMVAGQSQGGQAALGTAEYAQNDSTFKGAVAGAPGSSFETIMTQVAPVALAQIEQAEIKANVPLEQRNSIYSYATLLAYGAMTGVGIKSYEPNFDYLQLFNPRAKPIAKMAEGTDGNDGECLSDVRDAFKADIIKYMQETPEQHKVMDYPGIDFKAFQSSPSMQKFSHLSQPASKPINKPILVIQGEADTNVPAVVTRALLENLQKISPDNTDIHAIYVPKASHPQAIVWENASLMKFIEQHMPAK